MAATPLPYPIGWSLARHPAAAPPRREGRSRDRTRSVRSIFVLLRNPLDLLSRNGCDGVTVAKRMTMEQQEASTPKAVLWLAVVLGALLVVRAATGSERTAVTPAVTPPSGPGQTAYLDYQEVNYTVVAWGVPVNFRSAPFQKEPAWSAAKVIRGTLRFGNDNSNSMAFAWDRGTGKLYLDLNRNLDVTDDAAGVFVSRDRAAASYASFTNIRLPIKTASGDRRFLVDLRFQDYGGGVSCTATLHSFWQGKVTLGDEDWQIGIVANPFGSPVSLERSHLLLRPWAEREEPFGVNVWSPETFPFAGKLFVQGRAFALASTNEAQGDKARLALRLTGQQPALGELKISGAMVERVMLKGGPYLVVVFKPDTVVRVPAGRYGEFEVWLKQGDAVAHRDEVGGRLTIDASKSATLAAGGPLTNSVSVRRRGKFLDLSYQLVGASGEAYQLVPRDRTQPAQPPEFTIYRGDRKIASGKFQFG